MRYCAFSIIVASFIFGQNTQIEDTHPCDDPLLKIAMSEGIKSIPLKDILRLQKLLKDCEEQGGEQQVQKIIRQDWERDFRTARHMDGWTSTFSICVALTAFYYFVGLFLATI